MTRNKFTEANSSGEITSNKELGPPDLVDAVRKLYRTTGRFDEAIAARLAVDHSALRAISAIHKGCVSPKYILEQLGLKSASVTAVLDRLEKAGHITRTISANDRRSWDIALTDETCQATQDLYEVLGTTIADTFAERNRQEMSIAISAIDDLVASLDTAADKIS